MTFLDSLFYGLYMGFVGFTIPIILPLYCFYYSIKRRKNIGVSIFFGSLLSYIAVFIMIFLNLNFYIETDMFHIIINFVSVIICLFFVVKLVIDAIKYKEKDIAVQKEEYEDISSMNEKNINEVLAEGKKSKGNFSAFLSSVLLTLTSSSFIYWCNFSVFGSIFKINKFEFSIEIVNVILFIIMLFFIQLMLEIIFSKLSIILGKYIKPLIMRPFIIISALMFLAYGIYSAMTIINYIN